MRCCYGFLILAVLPTSPLTAADDAEPFTNSIGLKFVRIQAGSFLMGTAEGGDFDERPVHRVTISRPFHMSATEVRNSDYEQFDPGHQKLRGKLGFSQNDDEAVVFVSWENAMKFCDWLSKKDGKPYRLPTEAEWEYACRAGTTTAYHTGESLPNDYHMNQKEERKPTAVPLHVGRTPANAWGLHDMHGNVEEWCHDWYGPYEASEQADPVGRAVGDFKVSRGGSYGTPVVFLRSANRQGTLPEDSHWLIGFRVVQGELPKTKPMTNVEPPSWARQVNQTRHRWANKPDTSKPYFRGPRQYVFIPPNSNGPLFSKHNHQPGVTACPNGDLLAIWYTCNDEPGRELAVVASRLRLGSQEWEPAAVFWDAPDRNDHGNAIWWDGQETIHHFNGLSTDATWGKLALVTRTSKDNGATWSKARLINPEHGLRNQVIAGVFQTTQGQIVVPCDAVTGGSGGTAVHLGTDGGRTWIDPGAGEPPPTFASERSGAWIAGIHAGVVELTGGRLMALGRGDSISGQMPKSISEDQGKTWAYYTSGLPPIGGGQRLVLLRLREGSLFLASFAKGMALNDAVNKPRKVSGLFGALSFDEGQTWPVRRLITDDGPPRKIDGGGNTGWFTMSANTAEPKGYMAGTQAPDGVIHLISSKQHYAFNVAWLKAPMPASSSPPDAPADK